MILNLERLRIEYKATGKPNPEIAARIDILLEYTKIEMKFSGEGNKNAKHKNIHACLAALEITDRTIQRWKKIYIEEGYLNLGKKIARGRPPVAIRKRIQKIIEAYRKMYRWGAEVIQAHLLPGTEPEKRKRIISLFKRGFSKAEIERKTGVSRRSVGRILVTAEQRKFT